MENINYSDLFEQAITYPDPEYRERLDNLVGLEDYKERLSKILGILINPNGLEQWANKHYKDAGSIIDIILRRPPLVVLEGDVGSGKTELAMTIGDLVARMEKIDITLLPMSLSTRGEGRVGQMTQLISSAFDQAIEIAKKQKRAKGGAILLIDEADALAQSRESSQMHHEDRAGVNAFIRGIDRLANSKLPVVVIMCTNRLKALDPAIKRRAADIMTFVRPNDIQRKAVLSPLAEIGFSDKELDHIVSLTGPGNGREHGFTFSDLIQRLIPSIILDSYPAGPVNSARAIKIAKSIQPTPPFIDN